jgi:hypothetical protein
MELGCFVRTCKQSAPLRARITFLVPVTVLANTCLHLSLCFLGNKFFLSSVSILPPPCLTAYVLTQHCCRHVQQLGCFADVAAPLVCSYVAGLLMSAPSPMRGRVCHLKLVPTLASAVFLGSESRWTRNRILPSHIQDRSQLLYPPEAWWHLFLSHGSSFPLKRATVSLSSNGCLFGICYSGFPPPCQQHHRDGSAIHIYSE